MDHKEVFYFIDFPKHVVVWSGTKKPPEIVQVKDQWPFTCATLDFTLLMGVPQFILSGH